MSTLATTEFRRIGIWQTAFLGDLVLTLPLIQALGARYPEAELHLFVRSGLEGLFAAQKELTSARPFAKRDSQRSFLAARAFGLQLFDEGFDLWISPHVSLRSALVARSVGAPVRISYHQPWYQWLAYTHMVDRCFGKMHEVERLLRLGLPLGLDPKPPKARLDLTPEAVARADEIFAGLPRGRVLGMHPGSTWASKCWPGEYFAEIARRALAAGMVVLILAGPREEALSARIAATADDGSGRLVNLANMLTLPALAACIGRLDVFLGNDSGPLHLASTQDVPLLGLFGPTDIPLGFVPLGRDAHVTGIELSCRPCGRHGHTVCPLRHHRCMKELSPDQVWTALEPLLTIR